MRPVFIGIAACLLLGAIGCAKREVVDLSQPLPKEPIQIGVMQADPALGLPPIPFVSSLPVDDAAKQLGKKVYSRNAASLYRNPRLNAGEAYRIPAGTALWVSPTSNSNWMQVRLARGRSAFIRTSDTSAALALANAQRTLEDRARLSPRPRPTDEADAGDGRSSTNPATNRELTDAIEDAQQAFDGVAQQLDRLTAEFGGFQGDQSDWPAVRDGFAAQLNQMSLELQEFSQALNGVSEHSSHMSGSARSALQTAVAQTSAANDAIRAARALVDQMKDGEEWSSMIQGLGDRMADLDGSIDAVAASLDRMG
jgi:hypothetical protein